MPVFPTFPWSGDATLATFISAWGTQHLTMFVLLLSRLSGLAVFGPVFGHPDVPVQVRVFLIVTLSVVTLPLALSNNADRLFQQLDVDQSETITADEVPEPLTSAAAAMRAAAGRRPEDPIRRDEFFLAMPAPASLVELLGMIGGEFIIGIALAMGVSLFMAALQMAGQQIDQQIGVSLGETFNPEFDSPGSISGQTLHLLASVLFLCSGGHLSLLTATLDTLRVLPPGYAWGALPVVELFRTLVGQSLAFALLVSAPILVVMALTSLLLGVMGHTVPQLNVLILGFTVRGGLGLLLLAAALSGMSHAVLVRLPESLDQVVRQLTGLLNG
jgi:flagellar biosynthetic protein FliR